MYFKVEGVGGIVITVMQTETAVEVEVIPGHQDIVVQGHDHIPVQGHGHKVQGHMKEVCLVVVHDHIL